MNTIRTSFNQVKKQFEDYLTPAIILDACRVNNHIFRKRLLGPVETIIAFCFQVLNGNTACVAVRHWLKIDITDSAYCQARQRIPVRVFNHILRHITSHVAKEAGDALWNGRGVYLIDGTSFSMPDMGMWSTGTLNGPPTIIRLKPLPSTWDSTGVIQNRREPLQLSGIIHGWNPEILTSASAFSIIMKMIASPCGCCWMGFVGFSDTAMYFWSAKSMTSST